MSIANAVYFADCWKSRGEHGKRSWLSPAGELRDAQYCASIMMKTVGRHLLLEFYDCDMVLLDDLARLREIMVAAAGTVGATVVGETFHRFAPQGVSGAVVIAESHLSLHTWPENGYAAIDIFTCGGLVPGDAFNYLADALQAGSARQREIIRGLPEHIEAGMVFSSADVRVLSRDSELVELRAAEG